MASPIQWWTAPEIKSILEGTNQHPKDADWPTNTSPIPMGNTGAGPDGRVVPGRPSAVVQTANGPLALHEGEPIFQHEDGRVQVMSNEELQNRIRSRGIPGMATGGTFNPTEEDDQPQGPKPSSGTDVYNQGIGYLQGIVSGTNKTQRNINERALAQEGLAGSADVAGQIQQMGQANISSQGIQSLAAVARSREASRQSQLAGNMAAKAQDQAKGAASDLMTQGWTQRQHEEEAPSRDAKAMDFATYKAKYPQATLESYQAARGEQASPQTLFNTWSQNLSSLIASKASPATIRAQWEIGKNNKEFAPYMSTMVEPDWKAIEAAAGGQTFADQADNLIRIGVGAKHSKDPGYRDDMIDYVESVYTHGGSINPNTGEATLPDGVSIELPWESPSSFFQYVDFSGNDLSSGTDVNSTTYRNAPSGQTVNGQPVTNGQIIDWWNGLSFDEQSNESYYNKDGSINPVAVARAYSGASGGSSSQIPTTSASFGRWLSDNKTASNSYQSFVQDLPGLGIQYIDKDGKLQELSAGDKNLTWIWGQLQSMFNNGDYTKDLNSALVAPGTIKIDASGNVSKYGGAYRSAELSESELAQGDSSDAVTGYLNNPDNQIALTSTADSARWRLDALENNWNKQVVIDIGGTKHIVRGVTWKSHPKGGKDWTDYEVKDIVTGQRWKITTEGIHVKITPI